MSGAPGSERERARHASAPAATGEHARTEPVRTGPASANPARNLLAAMRAPAVKGSRRSALEALASDLAARVHDPAGWTAEDDTEVRDEPRAEQFAEHLDEPRPEHPGEHLDEPRGEHELAAAPAPAPCLAASLTSPLPRSPDAILLAGPWLAQLDAGTQLDEPPPPDPEPATEEPADDDRERPELHRALRAFRAATGATGDRAAVPDPFARRHDRRAAEADADADPARRRGMKLDERGRAALARERAHVKAENAKLDEYAARAKQAPATQPAPGATPATDERAQPQPAGPPAAKHAPTAKPGESGAADAAVSTSGGLDKLDSSGAIDAWKGKVQGKTDAVSAATIDDGDKYVLTFTQASETRTGNAKEIKKKLIADARAAVKPSKELEAAPLVPTPDPLPEARKLVDDLFPKPIAPDTMPKLERAPFGTIPELGTLLYKVHDEKTGQPTGEEHILRELEGGKFSEIQVLGKGDVAPPTFRGITAEKRVIDPNQGAAGAQGKDAPKGSLEERITSITEAQNKLVLKANPKAGASVTLDTDLPLAPVQVPKQFQVDTKSILAKLLAAPTRYAREITTAAKSSFDGGSVLPANYADDFIGDVVGDIQADLKRVADAADIKGQDLQAAVEAEAQKLDDATKEKEAAAKTAHGDAKKVEKTETKLIYDHIRGAREDLDHWLDDIAASTKGGYERKQIEEERDRLLANNKAKVERWLSQWEGMRKQRHKHLGEAQAKRWNAYEAAAEVERRTLAAAAKIDYARVQEMKRVYGPWPAAETELLAAIGKVDRWLEDTGSDGLRYREDQLFNGPEGFHGVFDAEVDGRVDELKSAGKKAARMIRDWATERLNKEIGTLKKLINMVLDWLGFARHDVDDWEVTSNEDNLAVNNENMLFLAEAKLDYEDGLTQEKLDAMKGLSEDQKAILQAYFIDESTKGDAVAALAAGLIKRIQSQRTPVVHRKIEHKVLKDKPDVVIDVANARGNIKVVDRVMQLVTAMKGMGTEKDKVYSALTGLDPVEARAVEVYYETKWPGRSLRAELDEELYDLGEQIGGSTHDRERAFALLDARPTAQLEDVVVQLDDAMRGGFQGWGTAEQDMYRLMRGKSARERAAIKRLYKQRYGRELRDVAYDELNDGTTAYTEWARFDALLKGDTKTADAMGLRTAMGAKQEMGGPITVLSSGIANWMTRDKGDAVTVFDSIKSDVEADARRYGWTSAQKKAEYAKRIGATEKEFDYYFHDEYLSAGDKSSSALHAAFGQSFGFDDARLLEGKRTDNLALISAATISIEHKAWILPDRKKIDDTLAAQYRTAYDEELWDLELAYEREKKDAWGKCTTDAERDAWHKKYDDPAQVWKDKQALAERAHQRAQVRSGENMSALRAAYNKEFAYGAWTHGNFDADVRAATAPTAFFSNFLGPGSRSAQNDKTYALLSQNGYLSGDQLLYFGVKGAGTNEDDVKYAHAGKSKEQIDAMYLALASRLTGKDYSRATDAEKQAAIASAKGWVLDDFSGRDYDDTELDMMGVAVTPEQKVARAEKRREQITRANSAGIGDVVIGALLGGPIGAIAMTEIGPRFRNWIAADELKLLDEQIADLKTEAGKVNALKAELEKMQPGPEKEKKWAELAKQYDRVALMERAVDTAVALHRKTIDVIADTVGMVIQLVVTAVAIIAAPFTAGASAGLAAAMWVAGIATAAGAVLNMAAKALIKGGAYGWEEFAFDAAMAVIETIASVATAGLGDKFLKIKFIEKLVQGGVVSRLVGHGLANGMEGFIQAIPGALFSAVANDATWSADNPFLAILGSMAGQVAMSTGMSGAFGALRAFKKGAPHLTAGEAELPTVKELTAARSSTADLDAMWKAYQGRSPGATFADFRAELDETILRMNRAAFADPAAQTALRGELLGGLPEGASVQRKALAGAHVEIVEGAAFHQMFPDAPHGAKVVWHGGKAIVIVPAGTDLGALAQSAPHLFEPPSGPRRLRPRGGRAEIDPKAAVDAGSTGSTGPTIKEPYSGPSLDSALDLQARNPGSRVIATESTIHPSPAEVVRLEATGGAFVPDNLSPDIPVHSVDQIHMRFPLPHDEGMRQQFMRNLADLQSRYPGRPLHELADEAVRRTTSATGYGPYALQRLKPGGTMEVVFWEKRILDELRSLEDLRFAGPDGKIYKFEVVSHGMEVKSQVAPHSGYGVPIGPHDPVDVVRLRKVEVPPMKKPAGGSGPEWSGGAGEVIGTHSGRPFVPERAGGPIRKLSYDKIKITDRGIDAVVSHLDRFEIGDAERAMVERLRRIAKGEIPATDWDKAFYAHELRESVRYRRKGWRTGQPASDDAAYELWNDLHTATLEDYRMRERVDGKSTLYHPDADRDALLNKPAGGRGPHAEGVPVHEWDRQQALGYRPGERTLPDNVRAALQKELKRSKILKQKLKDAGGSIADLSDDQLLQEYAAYRRRVPLKDGQVDPFPTRVAQGISDIEEGGRCATWVWVAAMRNAGWPGAVADHPGQVAGLIRTLRSPTTGGKLVQWSGSTEALAAHASSLAPGTQIYITGRSKNGVLHAMLGVVQPDGTLRVMHGPRGTLHVEAPEGGAQLGPYVGRGDGDVKLESRAYHIDDGDVGKYTEHKWFVLEVPRAPVLDPGDALPATTRKAMSAELRAAGHPREVIKAYDDHQLMRAYTDLQVELAPKRVAEFRQSLDWRARGELDAIVDSPHHMAAKAGDLQVSLGKALGVPVEIDPKLPRGSVRVVPELGLFGRVRGVKVVAGMGASVADVIAHVPALHQYKQYVGLLGTVRQVIDAVRRVLRGGGRLPIGTRAHEAWGELQKLPAIIEARVKLLADARASGKASIDDLVAMELEIRDLRRQLASHVRALDDLRPGRGYVAAEGVEIGEAGRAIEGRWQDTLGHSVNAKSPEQAHVPFIERGLEEVERLVPGFRARYERIRQPVLALQAELDALHVERQRLEGEQWKFHEKAQTKLSAVDRAKAIADAKAYDTGQAGNIHERIEKLSKQVDTARKKALEQLTRETEILHAAMRKDPTIAAGEGRAAADVAAAFALEPRAAARIAELQKLGIDVDELLQQAIRRYHLASTLGPRTGFSLDWDPTAPGYYDRVNRIINLGGALSQQKLGELRRMLHSTVFHEFTHHWEYESAALAEVSQHWLKARSIRATGDVLPVKIMANGKEVDALVGDFIDDYVGRIYPGRPSTEVFTVGMEHMYNGESMAKLLARDPEHFFLIMGIKR